jgi:hypothetical protein
MTSSTELQAVGSRGIYRPVAQVSLEQGFALIESALVRARELGLTDVVINTLGLSGFRSPGVFDRYEFALRMVAGSGGALLVAVVVRADVIDFQKIGMLMARNRGVIAEIFATEREALCWLDSLPIAMGRLRRLWHDDRPAI